ncbi:MAG: LytTR family DNA-binding domain-containing protein [Lachnospiraceae bacterium]|nr:LytTR family DNA-binding domain-containing protein [Lachnospiraceae bacterium]
MYRIALCDDEITELDKTEMMLHNYQKSDTEYELEISRFGSAEQLLERVRKQGYKPDLLLLDVYMPKKLGTEAAKELRDMGSDSRIVFLTASVTHALEAFRVDAVQYLVKPVLERELFLVLDKFLGEIERERKKYLLLKIDGRICRVALQEIVYCEAQRKYQYLYLTDGTRSQLRLTMAEIYKMLSDYTEFVKVGVSYIVNLEHIESLNSQEIQLDSGERLHLPRGAYQPLKEQYFQYYCRGGIQNDSGNHTVFIRTS